MKNKKRFLAAILTLAMSLSTACVLAEEAADTPVLISEDAEAVAVIEESAATYAVTEGTISELSEEESYIVLGETVEDAKRFNIGEETVIIKADGTPAALADCVKDAKVRVYHNEAATFSLPPQSFAKVIVIADSEEAVLPIYAVVSKVSESDDGYSVESEDGNYIFSFAKDVTVMPYRTRNIVTMSDVKEGSEILVWADIMTMSIPALVNPTQIMLLPQAVEAEASVTDVTAVAVNGEALEVKVEFIEETLMLPIRAISEKLGYTVTWNGEERSVLVAKGEQSAKVVLDQVARTAEQGATLIGELTYVPYTFFNELIGSEALVEGEILQINQ
ncbi:MAG: copper amine oxidase N-terminal domain-containing protein [Ruminococcaceae bacterium]|nr:copper amine oxidase N-terminal domain-containing protein [Oscillospiraceae bacterium]